MTAFSNPGIKFNPLAERTQIQEGQNIYNYNYIYLSNWESLVRKQGPP